MKTKGRRLLHRLSGMILGACTFGLLQLTAAAGSTDNLQNLNVGAAAILDADIANEYYFSMILTARNKWRSPFIEALIEYVRDFLPETE